MKKIILTFAVFGLLSLTTSCNKCFTCEGTNIEELNHDYCQGIYRTDDVMQAAEDKCIIKGGTWSEK